MKFANGLSRVKTFCFDIKRTVMFVLEKHICEHVSETTPLSPHTPNYFQHFFTIKNLEDIVLLMMLIKYMTETSVLCCHSCFILQAKYVTENQSQSIVKHH